jgi:uncharacterized protein YjiS (DUF1127 family)
MRCDFGGVVAMHGSSKEHRSSIIAGIAQWWRNWRGNRAGVAELRDFSPDEVRRLALEIGVNPEDIRPLAGKWPESADLLTRRMATLQLDPLAIARSQPAVSNDLRKLCSLCMSKGQCEHDLAGGAINSNWQEYCPNTSTLKALSAQRAAHTANEKKQ